MNRGESHLKQHKGKQHIQNQNEADKNKAQNKRWMRWEKRRKHKPGRIVEARRRRARKAISQQSTIKNTGNGGAEWMLKECNLQIIKLADPGSEREQKAR